MLACAEATLKINCTNSSLILDNDEKLAVQILSVCPYLSISSLFINILKIIGMIMKKMAVFKFSHKIINLLCNRYMVMCCL